MLSDGIIRMKGKKGLKGIQQNHEELTTEI
jgi:hypothetical protein